MKLPKYEGPVVPKIRLSQKSANFLVELYYEMIHVGKSKGEIPFDQDNCDTCVIGNGIRAGIINPTKSQYNDYGWLTTTFENAIKRIGINDETVEDFLFGGCNDIIMHGEELLLPHRTHPGKNEHKLDEYDACVRIAAVLDRAGYYINELPPIPRGK